MEGDVVIVATAEMRREGAAEGDKEDWEQVRFQPLFANTRRRLHHKSQSAAEEELGV